jgi:hypothetical protein
LFKDDKYKQKVIASNSMSLSKCGISDGMILYVSDDKAKIAVAPKSEVKKEPPKDTKSKVYTLRLTIELNLLKKKKRNLLLGRSHYAIMVPMASA